jgi:hypothetical protein
MALRTVSAPHSGPVDQPGEGAYRYARSGVARSATTRSNYVAFYTSIDWIIRDDDGNILGTIDISDDVLIDSLTVTQALNDEPDTCSFTLKPRLYSVVHPPTYPPQVGQEIRITWAPGGDPVFYGFIVQKQQEWRANNLQPPWAAIHCQDPMWRFDARLVTYRFPAQSVSASIAWLVKYFCNNHPSIPHPLDFSLAFVAAGMPSIPSVDVVNQRPSTVMRTLLAAVGGGFYIDGFSVHAWANSVSEPNQPNPTPLTHDLKTLHSFRIRDDAAQVRRRVLVEGRRTATLIALPATTKTDPMHLGCPIQDATIFPLPSGVDSQHLCRFGTQWMYVQNAISVTANGANPPQTKVSSGYLPFAPYLWCEPMTVQPPARGWIRVGNQYSRYEGIVGNPTTGVFQLILPDPQYLYGVFTADIDTGETVEWVDCVMFLTPHGLIWGPPTFGTEGDPAYRAHPTDTPVVSLSYAQAEVPTDPSSWPQLESLVQDGRYSYAGAQARADADLATFRDPPQSVEWDTDDTNASPGRTQVIELSSAVIVPAIFLDVTILRVEISFPLRTLPPRRRCTGGIVKPATFLDLVVTETN